MAKLIISCDHGKEDPERATLPFIVGNVAASADQQTAVLAGVLDIVKRLVEFLCVDAETVTLFEFEKSLRVDRAAEVIVKIAAFRHRVEDLAQRRLRSGANRRKRDENDKRPKKLHGRRV